MTQVIFVAAVGIIAIVSSSVWGLPAGVIVLLVGAIALALLGEPEA